MALQAIFTSIRSFLPTEIGMEVGAEHLADNAAPPRIVWVPTDERFIPLEPHGAALSPSVHILAQGEQRVEAHCWGADFDEAEDLKQAAIAAVRLAVGASAKPVSGTWPQRAEALVQKGRIYVLTFAFEIPVTLPEGVAAGEGTITSTGPHAVDLPYANPPPFGA